ncbi:MAG: hypothetical protein C0402_08080 [Thermodesulfovibrio sp.]|nr:hypothetical protein [Thermodesulfovibrio sp.]
MYRILPPLLPKMVRNGLPLSWRWPSVINRRYLLLGIALAVTIIAFDRYFLMPKAESMREELTVASGGLKKDEQFIRTALVPEKDVAAAAEAISQLEKRMIREKTEFLASVRLQDDVSTMAGKAGLRIQTTRSLPSAKLGNYLAIPLYFEGNGTIKQVSDLLKELESGTLLIKVDKLNIGITNIQNPKELKFKMQVSGVAKI